jgi:hypothetical protein
MKYEKNTQSQIFQYLSWGVAFINWEKYKQNPEWEYKKIE